MALDTWLIYLVATLALSITPGPNTLLALTHGALYGQRKALFTIAGGAVGFTLVVAFSMIGIGALLQTSAHFLTIMKWAGGAYLVWLGIQVWRSPPPVLDLQANAPIMHGGKLFKQGLISAVANPKAILFFSAFLPQFIDPQRSLFIQFVIMAATFVILEIITEALIASLSFRVRGWLQRSGRRFNQTCGATFVAIGGWLPLSR
ncbi:LysE family transporter [Alcaligenaceae bacterium]|nr:LysE family transporter [Alcaligenaceae bacterium]